MAKASEYAGYPDWTAEKLLAEIAAILVRLENERTDDAKKMAELIVGDTEYHAEAFKEFEAEFPEMFKDIKTNEGKTQPKGSVMSKGDRVVLKEVRHAEFSGLHGAIKKVIKSRKSYDIVCDNGKLYSALWENVSPE